MQKGVKSKLNLNVTWHCPQRLAKHLHLLLLVMGKCNPFCVQTLAWNVGGGLPSPPHPTPHVSQKREEINNIKSY